MKHLQDKVKLEVRFPASLLFLCQNLPLHGSSRLQANTYKDGRLCIEVEKEENDMFKLTLKGILADLLQKVDDVWSCHITSVSKIQPMDSAHAQYNLRRGRRQVETYQNRRQTNLTMKQPDSSVTQCDIFVSSTNYDPIKSTKNSNPVLKTNRNEAINRISSLVKGTLKTEEIRNCLDCYLPLVDIAFEKKQIKDKSMSLDNRLNLVRSESCKLFHSEGDDVNADLPLQLINSQMRYGNWTRIKDSKNNPAIPLSPDLSVSQAVVELDEGFITKHVTTLDSKEVTDLIKQETTESKGRTEKTTNDENGVVKRRYVTDAKIESLITNQELFFPLPNFLSDADDLDDPFVKTDMIVNSTWEASEQSEKTQAVHSSRTGDVCEELEEPSRQSPGGISNPTNKPSAVNINRDTDHSASSITSSIQRTSLMISKSEGESGNETEDKYIDDLPSSVKDVPLETVKHSDNFEMAARALESRKITCRLCNFSCYLQSVLRSHVVYKHKQSWGQYNEVNVSGPTVLTDHGHSELSDALYNGYPDQTSNENPVKKESCGKIDNKDKTKALRRRRGIDKESGEALCCPIPGCSREFRCSSSIPKHLKINHADEPNMKTILEEWKDDRSYLRKNKNTSITIICPLCQKTFFGVRIITHFKKWHAAHPDFDHIFHNLRKQIWSKKWQSKKEKEREVMNLICAYCGKSGYQTRSGLQQHMTYRCKQNKDKKQLYHCGVCGYGTPFEDHLKEHRLTHAPGKNFTCDLCGKSYSSRAGFLVHTRKMHLVAISKPISFFHCQFCHKQFYSSHHYKRHLTVHTGEANFPCDVCQKYFKERGALRKHKLTQHLRIYPYNCQLCGHGVEKIKYLQTHKCGRVKRKLKHDATTPTTQDNAEDDDKTKPEPNAKPPDPKSITLLPGPSVSASAPADTQEGVINSVETQDDYQFMLELPSNMVIQVPVGVDLGGDKTLILNPETLQMLQSHSDLQPDSLQILPAETNLDILDLEWQT